MDWQAIQSRYPDQWLLVEALSAHTDKEDKRHVDRLSMVKQCADGITAFSAYRSHHNLYPEKEYYFVHTSRTSLVVDEEKWLGVRIACENRD